MLGESFSVVIMPDGTVQRVRSLADYEKAHIEADCYLNENLKGVVEDLRGQ
jgi:hypothetical protein